MVILYGVLLNVTNNKFKIHYGDEELMLKMCSLDFSIQLFYSSFKGLKPTTPFFIICKKKLKLSYIYLINIVKIINFEN